MPPARDVYQLSLHGKALGQDIVNVLSFQERVGASGMSGAWLAQDFRTNMLTLWRALFGPNYVINRIQGRRVWPSSDSIHDELITSGGTGTTGSGNSHPSLAMVVTWKSPIAGRSHRGRTYLSSLPEGAHVNGNWNLSGYGGPAAFCAGMMTRYGVGTVVQGNVDFGIFSRPYAARTVPKRVGGVWTLINEAAYTGNFTGATGYVINLPVRSQRRRNLGIGS